jgi:ceramide glucosyltransferase
VLSAFSQIFFLAAVVGTFAVLLQWALLLRSRRKATPVPSTAPGISILKPLCGKDDDLWGNLENFATLDYPGYEVILGVRDRDDPAFPIAEQAVATWPGRFQLHLQRGTPGYNPKVNQLVTLEEAARHDILVVSDSNTRVPPGYLKEMAAAFEDPAVMCFTSPVVGVGEQTLGSLLDNVHLASCVGAGMVAAPAASGKYLVVGKSMALRRSALQELGGFRAFANILAEDYVIGVKLMQRKAGIYVAHLPVLNLSRNKGVKEFLARYVRWSVIHRTAISPITYLGQSLLNPMPLAAIGLSLQPSVPGAVMFATVLLLKSFIDVACTKLLRTEPVGLWALASVPVKDVLLFGAWVNGLFSRRVNWRGNRLRVTTGSVLLPPDGEQAPGDDARRAA